MQEDDLMHDELAEEADTDLGDDDEDTDDEEGDYPLDEEEEDL